MSRFPSVETTNASQLLQKTYSELKSLGLADERPLNWFSAMSLRPDLLASTWSSMQSLLLDGRLPSTIKQMIGALISAKNQCTYCLLLHKSIIKAMGVPPPIVSALTSGSIPEHILPPTQRAILTFAIKVDNDPKSLTEADFSTLRELGISDEEIIEIILVTAFIRFSNTWSDASAVDSELVEEQR